MQYFASAVTMPLYLSRYQISNCYIPPKLIHFGTTKQEVGEPQQLYHGPLRESVMAANELRHFY